MRTTTASLIACWALGVIAAMPLQSRSEACQCYNGYDPTTVPKMNITNFAAAASQNGTSTYSFDVAYWPDVDLAHCNTTVHGGKPGVFASVWGDSYCAYKGNGSYIPIWYYWYQDSDASLGWDLRVESKYLDWINICVECLEYGTHTVSVGDLQTTYLTTTYTGRTNFAIRPATVHG